MDPACELKFTPSEVGGHGQVQGQSQMKQQQKQQHQKYYPPLRYGLVNADLYRGSYPTLANFRFLCRLKLKTILSVTPEPPTQDLLDFAEFIGAEIIHVQALRTAPLGSQLREIIVKIINILVDASKQPIFFHCLDGRRITGIIVLLLRRMQGWTPQVSFAEFFQYLTSNRAVSRTIDESEVVMELERTSKEVGKFLLDTSDVTIPEHVAPWLWNGCRQTSVHGFKFKYDPPLLLPVTHTSDENAVGGSGVTTGDQTHHLNSDNRKFDEGTNKSKGVAESDKSEKNNREATDLSLSLAALDLAGSIPKLTRYRHQD
jgi:tyrosine-protein phosphatase OCA6